MTKSRRRYRKPERHVWVFSEPNPNLRPEDVARLLARAALAADKEDSDD